MYCSTCGALIDSKLSYCQRCGMRIVKAATAATSPTNLKDLTIVTGECRAWRFGDNSRFDRGSAQL